MQIGFAIPHSGSWATPDNVLHVATRAEELGYSSLWTFQRLLSPVDGAWGEMYRSVADPMVTLGYAAAITSQRPPAIRVSFVLTGASYRDWDDITLVQARCQRRFRLAG